MVPDPNLASKEVPSMQNEHGDAMEKNKWAQDGVARWMHALILMQPSGHFVKTWTKHMAFKCN